MWIPREDKKESFGEAAGTGLLMLALCVLTLITLVALFPQ